MPTLHRLLPAAAVFAISLVVLGYRVGAPGIATNLVDPLLRLQSQDEAVYAHSSIRMTTHGEWLTPYFLGRYALYKPPLLYWASAAAMKIGGISKTALRSPSVIAGALTATLLFYWVWRARSAAAGFVAAALLLSNHLFHTLSRTATMDAPLLLWTALAVYSLSRDPQLERRSSAWLFGGFVGLAIMTKAVAGVLPLIVLAASWRRRMPPRRVVEALAAAAIVALPWHVYQLIAHTRWFWNEYVLTEHLQLGLSGSQTSNEPAPWFYARRLFLLDPVLCVIGALVAARLRSAPRWLIAWISAAAGVLFVFQYRAAWYLLPLFAALSIAAGMLIPRLNRAAGVVLVAAFALKLTLPLQPFGLSYAQQSIIPSAARLEHECETAPNRPLALVNPDDQFYSADLGFSRVHYVFVDPTARTNYGTMKFGEMGIIVTAQQFLDLERLRPTFRDRLHQWGIDSDTPIATVILARDQSEAEYVRARATASSPGTPPWRWCGR